VLGLAEFFGILPIFWKGSLQASKKKDEIVRVSEFFGILSIFTGIEVDKVD
jgi:hypothetical protein